METLSKKTIFFKKMIVILSTILILSTIISPIKSHANIVNYPDTEFLDVNSPIVLEFDSPIEWNTNYHLLCIALYIVQAVPITELP